MTALLYHSMIVIQFIKFDNGNMTNPAYESWSLPRSTDVAVQYRLSLDEGLIYIISDQCFEFISQPRTVYSEQMLSDCTQ